MLLLLIQPMIFHISLQISKQIRKRKLNKAKTLHFHNLIRIGLVLSLYCNATIQNKSAPSCDTLLWIHGGKSVGNREETKL